MRKGTISRLSSFCRTRQEKRSGPPVSFSSISRARTRTNSRKRQKASVTSSANKLRPLKNCSNQWDESEQVVSFLGKVTGLDLRSPGKRFNLYLRELPVVKMLSGDEVRE